MLGAELAAILPEILQAGQEIKVLPPVFSFAELVAKTLQCLYLEIDRMDVLIVVHGPEKQRYLADLQIHVVDFHSNNRFHFRRILDGPNTNKLSEFSAHTIQLFGNAPLVFDLMFETIHQPVKSAISKISTSKSLISAVYHSFRREWL